FKSAADYLSSLDLKFLHNIQIHLKILRLHFLYSNLNRRNMYLENVKSVTDDQVPLPRLTQKYFALKFYI
ncbi:hypothetical protein, partial [uncultured Campylobacter sp.]|uniref:hypothetical protein n=1 Tax=uncultured Campylobacter sp. TaxID=218934 RepID=UPI002604B935